MNQPNHSERDHALLSASSSSRWLACPPSAVAAEAYPQQETDFTKEGTLAHEVAEYIANGDDPESIRDAFDEDIPAEMIECAKGYADYIQEQTPSNNAVVLLERRVDYSAWVPEGFGTCDCIILDGETLKIIDYKYGAGVKVDATNNPQMRLYALGALSDYGFAYDVKKIDMHIYQPRMNNISKDSMTTAELLAWADEIKPVALQASKGEGEYQPGEHCKFCPHAGRCRALTALCIEQVNIYGLKFDLPVLAPYEVAEILRIEPLITLALKRVREQALTTLMNGGEVPGYKVVEGRGARDWTNALKVAQTLKDAGFEFEEYTKTELLSPAAMEKAIGKKKANELLGDLIDKKPGAPTVAVETDKRPAYDRLAETKKDFD